MKPKTFKSDNVSLEKDAGAGWFLSIVGKMTHERQTIALEESEIEAIANVCVEYLLHHETPPKGMKKETAKK